MKHSESVAHEVAETSTPTTRLTEDPPQSNSLLPRHHVPFPSLQKDEMYRGRRVLIDGDFFLAWLLAENLLLIAAEPSLNDVKKQKQSCVGLPVVLTAENILTFGGLQR